MTPAAGLPELAPAAAFLMLLEIGAGTVTVAWALEAVERVGRGFAGTTALICAGIMGLDLLIGINLPGGGARGGSVPAGDVASVIHWSGALMALLVALALFSWVGTDPARHTVGALTAAVGAVAVFRAAVAFGAAVGGTLGAVAVLVPATLLAGSATAGMLLGHWYLISPDLSFRPLRHAVHLIFGAVAFEAVALITGLARAGPQARDQLLGTSLAPLFWLLVIGSGVVFTAGVNALTLHFARIRANQPATAMLYVLVITVLMGLVPAHLLFLRTGVPV